MLQVAACCSADGAPHPNQNAILGIWHLRHGRTTTLTLGELVVSEPEVVINGEPIIAWSPDAKIVAVCCPTNSPHDCISIVSIDMHAPVCVIRSSAFSLDAEFSMFELYWSPDASQMVVSFVHQHVIENGVNGQNGGNGIQAGQHDFVSAIVSFVAE